MNLAVQRDFSLPAASRQARTVSVLAGKVLSGDSQMSGVFCLKNMWLQMLACREGKPRSLGVGGRLFSRGAGWRHGVGAGFGQGGSEASCGCRICPLHRELPGCRMEKILRCLAAFWVGRVEQPPSLCPWPRHARHCQAPGRPRGHGRGGMLTVSVPGRGLWQVPWGTRSWGLASLCRCPPHPFP